MKYRLNITKPKKEGAKPRVLGRKWNGTRGKAFSGSDKTMARRVFDKPDLQIPVEKRPYRQVKKSK
jgi:hypothetical protein